MNNPLLVGVLHGLTDRDEQLQTGPHRKPPLVAVRRDRSSLDKLHHEERLIGLRGTAVEDACDVGVVHERERLPLGVEPSQHRARVHPDLDQLQRHLPLDRLGLLCAVDGAHATLAENVEEGVAAGDDLARDRSTGAVGRRNLFNRGPSAAGSVFRGRQSREWTRFRGRSPRRILGFERDRLGPWHGLGRGGFAVAGGLGFQGQAYRALDGEQRLDLGPEFGFPAALPVQVGGTLRRGGEV